MPGYFTKIVVADPHLFAQSVWENLPSSEKVLLTEREFSSQEWAPLDQRRFRLEPENYRFAASVANVGALRASRINGNGATESTLRSPGVDGFAISMIERGAGRSDRRSAAYRTVQGPACQAAAYAIRAILGEA